MKFIAMVRTALVLLGLLPAVSFGADQLIAPGAVWKYLDDGSDQGTVWTQPSFDDSSWGSGPAQLGYGDGDEATVVSFGPSSSSKYITTYFRHAFTVAQPSSYVGLRLRLLRDDGAIVHLNGNVIAYSNMVVGSGGYLQPATYAVASTEEDLFFDYYLSAQHLVAGTNLLAVEVHQISGSSSDISLDLELLGETDAGVIRGPYLQNQNEQALTVCWRTNTPTASRVRYGTAPNNLTQEVSSPTLKRDHEVRLTGLAPTATYFYAVGTPTADLSGPDNEHFFRMPPASGTRQAFRIWVLGDSGTGNSNARAVRDAYRQATQTRHTDLWLMLGDNAYFNGFDVEYQGGVFDMYPEMLKKSCLWPAIGNHEAATQDYLNIFRLPSAGEAGGVPSGTENYYSFDFANVHFVCLDSFASDRSVGGAMWTWLRADLASHDQDWTIAYWHHPPYTKGSHDSDTESNLIEMRERFVQQLEDFGVDLVLCGHSHSYERSFLIDGHHGLSSTWNTSYLKDPGDGRLGGDGRYVKASVPHAGAVYCVAGSSGKTSGGPLDHPAMVYSARRLGSMILEVDGTRLTAFFLNELAQVDDSFTIDTYRDASLTADTTTLPISLGGTQTFTLDAGSAHASQSYLLLGSTTGTAPGLSFGAVHLPLVPDLYFQIVISAPNSGLLSQSFGNLDTNGGAAAAFTLPQLGLPELLGLKLWHAYLVLDLASSPPVRFASNAFPVTLVF